MIFITVSRNLEMYEAFVKNNIFNKGADFVCYDSNVENIPITRRYNHFLDHYDYNNEDWFIFCHEDWQIKEEWLHHFVDLDRDSIYGPTGTKLVIKSLKKANKYFLGQIENSYKDGSALRKHGISVETGTEVGTFDCMCIIIHSSLIQKFKVRFDENLDWHLYTEELCIRLKEDYGIKSKIIQVDCRHWSLGKLDDNFKKSLAYVEHRFHEISNFYSATVTSKYFGGFNQPKIKKIREFNNRWGFLGLLFRIKMSSSGKLRIKIFNITVLSIKSKK